LDGLGRACAEVGRDPASIDRSILAFAVRPDPFESIDWFDEYVGAYRELGIDEVTFFWPPFFHDDSDPVPAAASAKFERIAAERIANPR
jgi:hypothetical protein